MTSRPYMRSEERRTATIHTVLQLATELHPQQITTAQIASAMGLTQGALFRHFPSRDAIFEAVMDWVTQQLLLRIEAAAVAPDDPLEALRDAFLAHARFVSEHPGVPRLILDELQSGDRSSTRRLTASFLGRYAVVLELLVKRGKARGLIRAEVAPDVVARHLIGAVQGLVIQSLITNRHQAVLEMAPACFALVRHAIAAPTPDPAQEVP